MKLQEENILETFSDIGIHCDFLSLMAQEIIEEINDLLPSLKAPTQATESRVKLISREKHGQ